jgi:hypothetical protein
VQSEPCYCSGVRLPLEHSEVGFPRREKHHIIWPKQTSLLVQPLLLRVLIARHFADHPDWSINTFGHFCMLPCALVRCSPRDLARGSPGGQTVGDAAPLSLPESSPHSRNARGDANQRLLRHGQSTLDGQTPAMVQCHAQSWLRENSPGKSPLLCPPPTPRGADASDEGATRAYFATDPGPEVNFCIRTVRGRSNGVDEGCSLASKVGHNTPSWFSEAALFVTHVVSNQTKAALVFYALRRCCAVS